MLTDVSGARHREDAKSAGSMVVSIPQTILSEVQIYEGDRVLIEASPPNRLVITKEMQTMPNTQQVEVELAVLAMGSGAVAQRRRNFEASYCPKRLF